MTKTGIITYIDVVLSDGGLFEEGLELPTASLSKYNRDEPRNPVGSGRVGGRWTKDPVAAGSIAWAPNTQPNAQRPAATAEALPLALRPVAPSLVDALGAEALEWLSALARRLSLPAAMFGAIFVPSANPGTSEEGVVPGHPGLSYALDHDTGTLRLSLDTDADPNDALVAQLGADGIYRDVETKVAIARAVGERAVLIDLDRAPAIGDCASADQDDDDPKLCPAPTNDHGGGRKLFDIWYEQYVRRFVNPQRQPLARGLAFALPGDTKSGWVWYDDCRESNGAMIEAKGNYAKLLASTYGRDWLAEDWLEQADKQVKAAGTRPVEWYFHDASAAAFATKLFAGFGSRITVHWLPYPGGVPNPNPRVH